MAGATEYRYISIFIFITNLTLLNKPAIMKNTLTIILGLLLLYGCAPLKEIHAFTENSQAVLENDHQIAYGYADYCWDSCYVYNTSARQLADFDCNCRMAEIYDSIIQKEYYILGAYFAALGKLSGAESYMNFAPIASAIREGNYGGLTITANESKVVNALANAATTLLTTNFKSKKIKEILTQYHDTISIAMEIMELHIDNLKNMIGLMRTKLQNRADLMMSNASTNAEKWAVAYTYKQKYKELGRIMTSYDKRYQSLDKIKQGHAALYENVNDLRSEGLKKKLTGFVTEIIYINNH